MNFSLPHLPARSDKPRTQGITMVMDKGLSCNEAEQLTETAGHLIDFVKLGFGTSMITGRLRDKISVYRNAGVRVYLGGTLFEAFLIRGMADDYLRLVDRLGIDVVEISDGSMQMAAEEKHACIARFSKNFTVLSEVGSKDAGVHFSNEQWVQMMKADLEAGSSLVIAEARESGNVGIYDSGGKADSGLIEEIGTRIGPCKILWEAPLKAQQVWFIRHFGPEVNLGNIASSEVIALETLRLGLRGDTFHDFLPEELKQR